ncbi:MAG: hypothetical protein ACI85J_000128 [Candidatus Poriferisodalaceae bacterium]|jgi:hypothetical protein
MDLLSQPIAINRGYAKPAFSQVYVATSFSKSSGKFRSRGFKKLSNYTVSSSRDEFFADAKE